MMVVYPDTGYTVLSSIPSFSEHGIRPVITVPINVARKYKVKTYEIGEVVSIGDDYL